jgi:hypothetical protein
LFFIFTRIKLKRYSSAVSIVGIKGCIDLARRTRKRDSPLTTHWQPPQVEHYRLKSLPSQLGKLAGAAPTDALKRFLPFPLPSSHLSSSARSRTGLLHPGLAH